MNSKSHFHRFWKIFITPNVFIFIIIGASIIFLTFLTNDNALEIAISGIASVFIGIGVNNFTSFEAYQRDEKKLKSKINHILKLMEITRSRVRSIQLALNEKNLADMKNELKELEDIISLSTRLIKEEEALD